MSRKRLLKKTRKRTLNKWKLEESAKAMAFALSGCGALRAAQPRMKVGWLCAYAPRTHTTLPVRCL